MAVDAVTGRLKWKTPVELPADINGFLCCGIHSRGFAALNGMLYRTTIDAHVVAINMADGKQVWKSKAADYKEGYTLTQAPLLAGGMLITGISGGEYGIRGFIAGWDPKTGERKWTRYTTAMPDEKGGDSWKPGMADKGGAPTWLTGSLRPRTRPRLLGHRQRQPVEPGHARRRFALHQLGAGDPALDRRTGLALPVLARRPLRLRRHQRTGCWPSCRSNGQPTKVLMQANRNGFFYVLDRTNGKLLSAKPFARKINWASGIDMASGRPIDTPMTQMVRKTEQQTEMIEVWPSAFGGKNWMPMSYDPGRRLVLHEHHRPRHEHQVRPAGAAGRAQLVARPRARRLPRPGRRHARHADGLGPGGRQEGLGAPEQGSPFWAGVLSTASGLVFTGAQTGAFMAFDARPASNSGSSRPARASPACRSPGSATAAVHHRAQRLGDGLWGAGRRPRPRQRAGRRLGMDLRAAALTLLGAALLGGAAAQQAPADADGPRRAGRRTYVGTCARCHGLNLVTNGIGFDLRTFPQHDRERFERSVTQGLRAMPALGGVLTPEQFDALWAYIGSVNGWKP